MKKKIFSLVFLLLVIYIPAGVFSQSGSLIQNFTAKWINKVPWLSYSNTPQAEFNTYVDSCTQLNCYVRILEQKDLPIITDAAYFNWIADPAETLQVPDSVKVVAKVVSTDPQNLPIVSLQVKLLQKSAGGGYFSEYKDISSTWNTYVWKTTDTYRKVPSFEGFGIGVIIGQSSSAMKAVIAIKSIELWKNGVCYYQYLFKPTVVGVENTPTVPTTFTLFQNYPNPFNPATVIKFKVPSSQVVTLKVYDMLGREVSTLANDFYSAGEHEVTFNASGLASGTYIYCLQAGHQVLTRKMLLIK